MDLGKLSQLGVYDNAVEYCSEEGNREGVEMLGRLIVDLAKEKREMAFDKLDAIMAMDKWTETDRKTARNIIGCIEVYDSWIKGYSPDSPRYREKLSQADVNSWKQGGTSCA